MTPEQLMMLQALQAQQQQQQQQPQPYPVQMQQAPPPMPAAPPMPTSQGIQQYPEGLAPQGFQEPQGLPPMRYPSGSLPVEGIDPAMVVQAIQQGPLMGLVANPQTQVAVDPQQGLEFNLGHAQEQGAALDYMKGTALMAPPTTDEIAHAERILALKEAASGSGPTKKKSSPEEKAKRLALAKKAKGQRANKDKARSKKDREKALRDAASK